ncbi:MAG: glycosyltransferase family 39 protein [Chloracidobacterium sp.]|nr:glycosyltransferase family 39 protein [Chloracidobacterium sp.]
MNPPKLKDKYLVLPLTLVCALIKIATVPASLWEWDDMLFASALSNYDVASHSPHPPGFPVFIGITRPFFWLLKDEYIALTVVSLIFSCLLAPALYYFFRGVFRDNRVALAGSLLACFMPNVWFYSGSGRSDVPAMVMSVIGLVLMLRAVESRKALYAGCAVLGLGMGIRVTVLPLIGVITAMVFIELLLRRQYKIVAVAASISLICALLWYVPLILDTGWEKYRAISATHSRFIIRNDTIFSGGKLTTRINRYFNDVFGRSWIKIPIYLFTLIGISILYKNGKKRELLLMTAAFVPYMLFVFVLNAPANAPLYAMPYMPFFTGLAAYGIISLGDALIPKASFAGVYGAILLTFLAALWVWPLVKLRHTEISPPVRALQYLKQHVDPEKDTLCYSPIYFPHLRAIFPQARRFSMDNCPAQISEGRVFALTDTPLGAAFSAEYHWNLNEKQRKSLIRLSLGYYTDAYVTEIK